jgi:hypothetical protein
MRKPMITKERRFDLATVLPQMNKVIEIFDRYLEKSPYRFGKSKHALMGPVAKILERAQTGLWSKESLTGYALRIHEMHPKSRGFISPETRCLLEDGIRELMSLIEMVPVTILTKVMEKMEYGLYYQRRKSTSEWIENIRKEFENYLIIRYPDVELLKDAWKDKNVIFDGIFPSRSNDAYKKGKGKRKEDIDEFWRNRAEEDIEEED